MHDSESYRELHLKFIHAHTKFGDRTCPLMVSAPVTRRPSGFSEREYQRLGTVAVAGVVYQVGVVAEAAMLHGSYDDPDCLREPLVQFNAFSKLAGGCLPLEIRGHLDATQVPSINAWLTLLWAMYPPEERLLSMMKPGTSAGGIWMLHLPFRESADAIELCGLHTDSPMLPHEISERRCADSISPDLGSAAGESASSDKKSSETGAKLKRPSDNALKCFRTSLVVEWDTQNDLAKIMTKKLYKTVDQGQVSRWLSQVNAWIEAGNVLPNLPSTKPSRSVAMDPGKLELGARRDGLTPRQRAQRSEDSDD